MFTKYCLRSKLIQEEIGRTPRETCQDSVMEQD